MPTVSVGRARLLAALGTPYSDEEFQDLCFNFGIELDEVTTKEEVIRKQKHLGDEMPSENEEIIYKIDVPANRHDLLCLEGISQALRIFLELDPIPTYRVADVSEESLLEMHVMKETSQIRPYVVCAVLRGITFDEARYDSFIDLRDRLHHNICRKKTLVAIGTHDLDTIEGPFTYDALPPSDTIFAAHDHQLMRYENMNKLFPVIYDRNRTVLSVHPMIINGAHSAVTLQTKNVFIECTATDLEKAKIVLNTMVTMFSMYCKNKYEAEPVRMIYPDLSSDSSYSVPRSYPHGASISCPDLSLYHMDVSLSYITGIVGDDIPANKVAGLLKKMQLHAGGDNYNYLVSIPPTRSDVLHPCDVAGNMAIANGYKKLTGRGRRHSSSRPNSLVASNPLSQFSDLMRMEIAMEGFTEVLSFVLGSYKENFDMLRQKDDKKTAVIVGNPRSAETEVPRPSLMPGLLKTVAESKNHPKPIKIFEVGDVVLLDESSDVGARNQCNVAALYCASKSGFEVIQGLLDRIMEAAGAPFVSPGDDDSGYYIELSHEPEFLSDRQACIIYKGTKIGTLGIVHPEVLQNFGIPDPCSFVELNLQRLL